MKVRGKVIVVTGAGGGMGRELTLQLLQRGAQVAAVDRSEDGLRQTAAEAGAGTSLSLHTLDITDRDGVAALPAAVIAHHNTVDGVINNAGVIQPFVPVHELSDSVIDRMFDVNLFGTIRMVRAFVPHLLPRPEAHLVNVSSMGGFLPVPGQTMYGAAKAAVKLLSEGMYAELLDTNVRVSVVMPGAVATEITTNSGVQTPGAGAASNRIKPLPAADAARIILDGIERDALHILVGNDARAMHLLSRLAPRAATHLIQRVMRSLTQRET